MRLFENALKHFRTDLGIDLGTANTVVFAKGEGIVLREPSVVAVEKNTRKILAIGSEAKLMLGRTPGNIIAIRPMRDGVISDFEITEFMIRRFIQKVTGKSFFKPRVVIGVPSGITNVERRAVEDAAIQAGAKSVMLIQEPMAAAIGANLPVEEPRGTFIVDIGGGTTEVAVISMGEIVLCQSIRVAGDEMDEHIVAHCRQNYNLLIGERTAEQLKISIGSAYPQPNEPRDFEVKGRDLITGLPKTFTLTTSEVRHALSSSVNTIVQIIRMVLEKTPPELTADILDGGINLAGGGALLQGIDNYIADETSVAVHIMDDPLSCVALGTGKVIEEYHKHKNKLILG